MLKWKWYAKQLLPLTYWTLTGRDGEQNVFVIWRMWLGRCFDVVEVKV